MTKIQRLMKLHRLMDAAGDAGSDGGGTGTGQKPGDDAGKSGDAGDDGKGSDDDGKTGGGDAGSKPSDAEAKLLRDVMKHKTRATTLEGELAAIQTKLKAFEGLDPERMRALLTEQEELETKKLEAKGEYDRLLKQMGERHTAEKGTLEEKLRERDTRVSELSRQIADMTVGTAFTQSKFVQDGLTLTPAKARVIYGSHFEFKDGAVVGFDKPAGASERTMLVNGAGDALSFEEALQKLVEADPDKDHLLRSKMKGGSGSSTQSKVAKKLEDAGKPALKGIDRIAAGLAARKADGK